MESGLWIFLFARLRHRPSTAHQRFTDSDTTELVARSCTVTGLEPRRDVHCHTTNRAASGPFGSGEDTASRETVRLWKFCGPGSEVEPGPLSVIGVFGCVL